MKMNKTILLGVLAVLISLGAVSAIEEEYPVVGGPGFTVWVTYDTDNFIWVDTGFGDEKSYAVDSIRVVGGDKLKYNFVLDAETISDSSTIHWEREIKAKDGKTYVLNPFERFWTHSATYSLIYSRGAISQ